MVFGPVRSSGTNNGTGDGPIDRSSDRFKTLYPLGQEGRSNASSGG